MFEGWNIGVVVPARNEAEHIELVLKTVPDFVDKTVVIDDGSTDGTGNLVGNADLVTLTGKGVGAAIDAGHRHLLSELEKPFISVVMAGDGQMDPDDMESLLRPIITREAHHVKGERFDRAEKMPFTRRFGTFLLSILTNLACGQSIRDPQCGYTATTSQVLESWDWNNSWRGYGYPNWWLMRLSQNGWVIAHAPVKAIYQGQKSGIKITNFLFKTSLMLFLGLHLRIVDNTMNRQSLAIPLIWITYIAGWFYSPIIWIATHLFDRWHVSKIRRVTR
ncbi:MAG: glycosyltransferase family 2 protein [Candidatus Poseidoniaceae archaeon]|jgi:glycosyltransferase involved in cell wall biosynthesis|nr:glycosyltransferase family 2 protein [Candidatus Poseidoniaceae archaeon]